MKNKWLLLGLILSAAINIGVFGSAGYRLAKKGPAENCPEGTARSSMEFLSNELGLSPSQVQEFESVRKFFEPQINRIKNDLKEKRTRLVEKLMEPEAGMEKLLAQVNEIESLQAELQKLAVEQMLKEKAALTPEQQKRFFTLISSRLCPEGRHAVEELSSMMEGEAGGCLK